MNFENGGGGGGGGVLELEPPLPPHPTAPIINTNTHTIRTRIISHGMQPTPRGGSSVPGLFLVLLQTCLRRPVLLSGFLCSGHFYKLLSISLHTQLLYFSPSSLNSTTFDSRCPVVTPKLFPSFENSNCSTK